MKCLIRTKKAFTKDAIKRIFNYDIFVSGTDNYIARIRVPFESEIVKKNIEYINNALNDIEHLKDEIDCNKIYEYPILNYLDYYHTVINYKVKIIDGKPIKEVIINDELKDVVTDYFMTVGPFGFETDEKIIILTGLNLGQEMDLWNYDSIFSLIPNIVDTLIKEGYAEIEDEKGDESYE